jgi:hypothetical protein
MIKRIEVRCTLNAFTQQRYTITNIKDHAQTLLQTITRPQLYSECASVVQVSKT